MGAGGWLGTRVMDLGINGGMGRVCDGLTFLRVLFCGDEGARIRCLDFLCNACVRCLRVLRHFLLKGPCQSGFIEVLYTACNVTFLPCTEASQWLE